MIKWNNLDEMGNEFVYRKNDLNAYVYRGQLPTGQKYWFWEVNNSNAKLNGRAPIPDACFGAAEEVIEVIQNWNI